MWEIIGFAVSHLLAQIFPQLQNNVIGNYIFVFLVELIVFVICRIILKKNLYPLKKEKKSFLFLALLPVYISLMEYAYIYFTNRSNANYKIFSAEFAGLFFALLLAAISISLCEEFIWRKVIFLKLLSAWNKTKKGVLCSIILSSVLFGLCHYINVLTGNQPFLQTTIQVLSSVCMGIFVSGIFYRTGGIIVPILIHCICDFSNLFMNELLNYSYDLPPIDNFLQIIVPLLQLMIGISVVLSSKKYRFYVSAQKD